jgi:hypothetical protein
MIPLWLQFLLLALAVYRVAHMIGSDTEEGPWSVFADWRHFVGQKTWVGRGFHCPLCISFWLGFGAALLLPWFGWAWYIAAALALSGVTVVLHRP